MDNDSWLNIRISEIPDSILEWVETADGKLWYYDTTISKWVNTQEG